MMKWTKPSASTIDYFERIAPGPPIEARRMFGMPSRFLNGHMLVSVFGDSLMLHLSESDREECIAAGARPFAPHGRSAKEYVEVQIGHFEDQTLKEWIARGMRYLGSLPPRLDKPEPKAEAKPVKTTPVKAKAKAKPAKPAKPVKAKAEAKRPAKKSAPPRRAKKAARAKKATPRRAAPAKKATPRRAAPAKKAAAKKSAAKKRR